MNPPAAALNQPYLPPANLSAFDTLWSGPNGVDASADQAGADFHFDFDTFAINPEALWAYHVSIPGSPIH
jgi:hypothetical protein